MVTTLWWRVEFSGSPAVDSFPGLGLYDCRHCANLLSSPICPQQSPPPASYTSLSYLDLTLVLTSILFATTLCTRDWNPAKSAALCWKPGATRQDAGIPSSPTHHALHLHHCWLHLKSSAIWPWWSCCPPSVLGPTTTMQLPFINIYYIQSRGSITFTLFTSFTSTMHFAMIE